MALKTLKILGVGSPILDILVNVDDAFIGGIEGRKGGMELVSSDKLEAILANAKTAHTRAPGGSAGNTIFGLARLGVKTAFLGKVGSDEDGEFYTKRLSDFGGDTKSFRHNTGVHTGRCLSLVTPDSERTMRTDLGAAATLSADEISENDFADISHVHIEGYLLYAEPVCLKVLETAKKCNCTVSLDLASFEVVKHKMSILPDVLKKYVDIVFANEDEAREFCGTDSSEKAIEILSGYCDTVAVKLGKKGCILKSGTKTASAQAELVNAVDTTGAGDLWQAGFLYAFLNGKDLDTCGRYGAILGAEVVQVMGAEIPPARWDIIRSRLK